MDLSQLTAKLDLERLAFDVRLFEIAGTSGHKEDGRHAKDGHKGGLPVPECY